MLVGTCEIVRIEDTLVVRSSGGASGSALEKHLILIIGVVFGLGLNYGAGLGSLCRFRHVWSATLSGGRFDFYLVDGQMVLVLAIFTSDSVTELFEALSANAEFLSDGLLRGIVSEEDEGLESCIWVSLFVDAPQDVVKEGLEMDRHGALGRLIGSSDIIAIAGGILCGCLEQLGWLVSVHGAIDRLRCLARTRTRRLGGLGHVLEAMRGADGSGIRHVEGVERAF